MIATTRDQANRIIAIGISANTADLWWVGGIKPCLNVQGSAKPNTIHSPAWSLSRLLELLPKHMEAFPFSKWFSPFEDDVICEKSGEDALNGNLTLSYNGTNWIVDYDWNGFTGKLPQSENPIEECVKAIELLSANGYKFNEV